MKKLTLTYTRILVLIILILTFNVNGLIEKPEIKIEKEVSAKLEEEPEVFVIVSLKEPDLVDKDQKEIMIKKLAYKQKQEQILSTLSSNDFRIKNLYTLTPGFSGYITKSGLEKLKNDPNVNNIHISRKGEYILDSTIPLINADDIWKLQKNNINITGVTQSVCIIDSGIDFSHSDFSDCNQSEFIAGNCKRIVSGYDYANLDSVPEDLAGHGTFVASVVGSNNSLLKGVAPQSKLIILKNGNFAPDEDATQMGVEWCYNNRTKFNISVITISSSLGADSSTDNCFPTNDLSIAIRNAYDAGMTITIAAGNDGSRTQISYPACVNGSISVGATNDNDKMSSFSNRNGNLDLVAPGENICAARASGTSFGSPTCIDSQHAISQGTSFSTPHVAGAVALLQDVYNGKLTPNQIQEALNASGKAIHDSFLFFFYKKTFQRIDVKAALEYLPVLDVRHLDWPTVNHDYRRTGFTLLKGDLKEKKDLKNNVDFFLDAAAGTEQQVVKPSVADIDGNGLMDTVILVHKTTFNTFTKMFITETSKQKFLGVPTKDKTTSKVRGFNISGVSGNNLTGGAIYYPPTLADLDGNGKKEIITGVRNGTIYVYELSGRTLTQKWKVNLEERFSSYSGQDEVLFNGGSAVADIDLDGQQEVILADVGPSVADGTWNGKVYVLNGVTGANETSFNVGNGGTYDAISIANIDEDDNPEIIVPTLYGIKVLDYNQSTGKLTQKCSNTHGLIEGSAVVYDVDKDNQYELVYVTSSWACASGKTCANKLYVINAKTCGIELEKTLSEFARPTPTIANLDSDAQAEVIISSVVTVTAQNSGPGNISAIDSSSGTVQWTYNDGGNLHPGVVSPNVADIDNDGNYNIILGENAGSTVHILKNDGTEHLKYNVLGFMDNGLAIADLDNDGVAEIAFKRAASPETVFVSVSNINTPPEITKISNVTAIAGNLINISQLISASDAEGNGISLLYSSPFNSSGQWQTTINDTGNYSILVEASDGNLSTSQFIDVIVFNETTKLQNTFTDGNTNKLLNFNIIHF